MKESPERAEMHPGNFVFWLIVARRSRQYREARLKALAARRSSDFPAMTTYIR